MPLNSASTWINTAWPRVTYPWSAPHFPLILLVDLGVTTAVDGGSAGCMTFAGFRRFIAERSETRVLAFLHVACHGLAGAGCSGGDLGRGGESDHLNAIKTQGI